MIGRPISRPKAVLLSVLSVLSVLHAGKCLFNFYKVRKMLQQVDKEKRIAQADIDAELDNFGFIGA